MPDQRVLFQQFYTRACTLDNIHGRKMGREIYDLLCNQTLALRTYDEIEHESYGRSAYFTIYLHVCKNGKQIYLPGNLLLSMRYFNRAKPVIILRKEGKLLTLNHSIVANNGIVQTAFLKDWNSHPSIFDFVRDVVNQLQGNPFDYEKEDPEDDSSAEQQVETKPEVPPKPAIEFNDHIPYNEIQKGEILGKGSFATAYVAKWNNKLVAVKEWTAPVGEYEKVALNREIEIQRALNHPNCLSLYGLSKTPSGKPVLVMELADGSLADITTKREHNNRKHPDKPIAELSNQEKYRIIKEIAEGIAYIHSCGYVHRDIKLDNILMKDGHPKIADFGLARACKLDVSMTMTFCGSPVFMAPELIMGKHATSTVDCYSFGCILTEILYEKTCYFDYRVRTQQIFFRDVIKGLKPTILPDTPREARYLIEDCFKSRAFRPPMNVIVDRINTWEPDKW